MVVVVPVIRGKKWLHILIIYCFTSVLGLFLYMRCISTGGDTRGDIPPPPPPAVVVELVEGMGNQMFKYASAYSLAQSLGVPLYVVAGGGEVGWWEWLFSSTPDLNDPLTRSFLLDMFKVPLTPHNTLSGYTYKRSVLQSNHVQQYTCEDLFNKRLTTAQPKLLISNDFCHSEEYFRSHKQQVLDMFHFSDKFLNSTNTQGHTLFHTWRRKIEGGRERGEVTVAVHVRRGDYLKLGRELWVTPMSFYHQAIALILAKFCKHKKKVNLFVFSDSIEEVRGNLRGNWGDCGRGGSHYYELNFVSHENMTSVEEFYLMTLCLHAIISNSTFSWWAAYLMQHNKGRKVGEHTAVVVAPTYHPHWWDHYPDLKERAFKKSMAKYNYPLDWIVLDPYQSLHV